MKMNKLETFLNRVALIFTCLFFSIASTYAASIPSTVTATSNEVGVSSSSNSREFSASSSMNMDNSVTTGGVLYYAKTVDICPATPWVTDPARSGQLLSVGDVLNVAQDPGTQVTVTSVDSNGALTGLSINSYVGNLNAPKGPSWASVVSAKNSTSSGFHAPCLIETSWSTTVPVSSSARTSQSVKRDYLNPNDWVYNWNDATSFSELGLAVSKYGSSIVDLPCGTVIGKDPNSTAYYSYLKDPGADHTALYVDTCNAQTTAYLNGYGLGDGNTLLTYVDSGLHLDRQDLSNPNGVGMVVVSDQNLATTGIKTWGGGSIYSDVPVFQVNATQSEFGKDGTTPTTGSVVAGLFKADNYSDTNWAVQAQGLKVWCNKYHQNGSCWGYSTNINNFSGRTSPVWDLINENDALSNGPEGASALYDPKLSHRFMDYASAVAMTASPWAASTAYTKDSKVMFVDPSGKYRIGIVLTAGTSGTTAPAWTSTEGDVVSDGTVSWTVGTTQQTTIGVVHWINCDGPNGSTTCTATVDGNMQNTRYNFGYSTDAYFNNSVFDASHAHTQSSIFAAFRVGADHVISFSDRDNASSDSDLNNSTLGYNSTYKELVYAVNRNSLFTITDSGSLYFKGSATFTTGMTSSVYSSNSKLKYSQISSAGGYSNGDRIYCSDCRAPSQATGSGTGRWIYLDSASTWRTDDGLVASN